MGCQGCGGQCIGVVYGDLLLCVVWGCEYQVFGCIVDQYVFGIDCDLVGVVGGCVGIDCYGIGVFCQCFGFEVYGFYFGMGIEFQCYGEVCLFGDGWVCFGIDQCLLLVDDGCSGCFEFLYVVVGFGFECDVVLGFGCVFV